MTTYDVTIYYVDGSSSITQMRLTDVTTILSKPSFSVHAPDGTILLVRSEAVTKMLFVPVPVTLELDSEN